MKNKIIALAVGTLMVLPSFAFADTTTDTQRITLLQQLVSLMQELITLENQVGTEATTTPATNATTTKPLFGRIPQAPMSNDITIKTAENDSINITIAGNFAKGIITTYPTSDTPEQIAAGLKAPNTPDTNVRRNGNVLQPNDEVSNYYSFESGVTYTWIIDLTDADGNTHEETGEFTMP